MKLAARKPKKAKTLRMRPRVCTITIRDINLKTRQVQVEIDFDKGLRAQDGMTPAADSVFTAFNAIVKKRRVTKIIVDGEEIE